MDMWKADKETMEIVSDLIGKYHPDLALIDDQIAVVFREKASKAGGRVILGKSRKAPPLLGVLGDTDYKFIIELAADEWDGLSNPKREALLDHHLCACRAEEDAKTGNLKCSIAPPDVAFYWDELDRHGDWRPRPEGEGPAGTSPVMEVFGAKKGDSTDSAGT